MCDRVTVHRDSHKMLASLLACLADGIGNFVCLAKSISYLASVVANDNHCAEAEITAAFHNFAATADHYGTLIQLIVLLAGNFSICLRF